LEFAKAGVKQMALMFIRSLKETCRKRIKATRNMLGLKVICLQKGT